MAYVTYNNRSSANYRFTVTSLDDPAIAGLKEVLKKDNAFITRARRLWGPNSFYGNQTTKGIRIRGRGSRKTNGVGFNGRCFYDTPFENATHFDVYVRDYK